MPKVSILMNCRNGEPYLKEAIDSVYAQDFSDWEIIFVDNLSADKSAEIARSYDSRIKYYQTPEPLTLYAARNYGLQFVTGEFLAFLDTDDYWEPTKLSQQLAVFKTNNDIYLCCTGAFRNNTLLGKVSKFCQKRSHYLSFKEVLESYPVYLSTVMIRSKYFIEDKIKFEPTANLTGDAEFFLGIIYKHKAYYIAHTLTTLKVHTTNLSAKLVNDWPKELEATINRLTKKLSLTSYEKMLLDKRYIKTKSLVYLANKEYKNARSEAKKYLFKDLKLFIIYVSTFNRLLISFLLKLRGFS